MSQVTGQLSPAEGLLLDWSVHQPLPDRRLPVGLLTRAQKATELQRVQALRAMTAAYEAELVLGLAEDTPDTLDPPPGSPGAKQGSWAPDTDLPGVSEFFTAELAVVLNCGRGTAAHLARRAWLFRESLPGTWAALSAGTLDEARARVLVDVLAHTAPAVAREVEARLLPDATSLTLGRLRARAVALLLDVDADAVDARKKDAQRQSDVRCYPSVREGMATLAADLPAEEAAAAYDLIDQLARMAKTDGDDRPIGHLRAQVCSLLLRRPTDTGLPEVRANLTITAALEALEGSTNIPGSVNGLPITAGHVRDLLARLGALGLRAPHGGTLGSALTDPDGRLLATTTPQQLAHLTRRSCPQHPSAGGEGGCGCPVLDRPASTGAYTPTTAQQTFIRTRDRSCRFPSCGQRAGWADTDHLIPHAHGGPTDCTNLCCLCRSHHRLKTFARSWRFTLDADGTLHVTTPSGITRTTRPPGMHERPADPPQPSNGTEPAGEPPPPPTDPDDDPPPF